MKLCLQNTQSLQMNNHQFQPLFKQQSTKSLSKYRSESIQKRVSKIGKELLIPSFPKKIEQKNIFTITSNTSTNSVKTYNMPKMEEDLQKRVTVLQNELKRKLNEDSILRNLFKTKHTSQMSHLNVYLEVRKLQDRLALMSRNQEQLSKKMKQYQEQMRGQEQQHMKNMQELNQCVSLKEGEWLDQKIMLNEEINKLKMLSENNKYLMQEMKKKNAEVISKQKQIAEQLNLEREAHNLAIIKLKSDHQREVEEMKAKMVLINVDRERKQKEDYLTQKAELQRMVQNIKDEKQKLQMKVVQLEEVNNQLVEREQWFRKEQKQKYNSYYEKLRRDYEIQIENLMRGHEESMIQERKQVLELKNVNTRLNEEKTNNQHKIAEMQKDIFDMKVLIDEFQKKQNSFKQQIARWQDRNSKLSRQIKQIKYQKQQISQKQSKIKFQLADSMVVRQRLQKKVGQLTQQNMILTQKYDQLKRASEYSQSYLKLNDKIYNQNYKTLGRLIEVNHKIRQYLSSEMLMQQPIKAINEQSLTEVVSYLAQQLEQLIRVVSGQRRLRQEMARQRNIQNREIINVLQNCKHLIKNQNGEGIMARYIGILKNKKSNSEESTERVQTYHDLIDCIINLNNIKYYNSENTEPKYEKDSLDGTFMLKQAESIKKFNKHSLIERESSCKNLKRKNRIQTQPSVYDMPLKCKFTTEDDDKENVFINNRGQPKNNKKEAKVYLNEVRERLSSKNGSKWKERPDQQEMRSQIQRKYFRS